ncbi:MAG: hypothetical protein IKD78_09380, partial [Bacteroidales bacterium]|nr:hypothetical protein [Bacteroidales bacterium]
EVQLEPMAGSVAVPNADQMYTVAEFATLDAVWNACNASAIWADNMVTLDTYSGQGMNTGYAALKFSGTPNTYGYAKFDKTVSRGGRSSAISLQVMVLRKGQTPLPFIRIRWWKPSVSTMPKKHMWPFTT